MTGPTSTESLRVSPTSSSAIAPFSIASMRSATSSCRQRMRSAEQRWPAESKADDITSATTCSGRADESTTIAFRPPVSAISGTGAAVAGQPAGELAFDQPRDRRRAGEDDALHARIGDDRRPDLARAGQERERLRPERPPRAARGPPRRRSAASPRPAWRRPHCRRRAPRRPGR